MVEGGEGRGEGQKEERRDERGEGERREKGASGEGGREGGGDKRRVGGQGRREVGKEESGKGQRVHPMCFLMWPSVDLLPSFPHYSVRHAVCSEQTLRAPTLPELTLTSPHTR